MNAFKGLVLLAALAAPLPAIVSLPALAETATDAKVTPVAADDAKTSETDKRAKAIDCSKQADAKGLHGEARKKFRSTCKRGK